MIRRLQPTDWAIFRDIRLDMLGHEPEAFASSLSDWQDKPQAEIEAWLRNIACFAALAEGRCLATAAWAFPLGVPPGPEAQIIAVYTRPSHRRSGLSRQLLAAVEDDAQKAGITKLVLNVVAANQGATALYQALGYEETGRVPAPSDRPGFAQIKMQKSLSA